MFIKDKVKELEDRNLLLKDECIKLIYEQMKLIPATYATIVSVINCDYSEITAIDISEGIVIVNNGFSDREIKLTELETGVLIQLSKYLVKLFVGGNFIEL